MVDVNTHQKAADEIELAGDLVIMDVDHPRAGRRTGDSGMFSEMPWYVRAVAVFGVPSVIAMFLVYQMAGGQAADVQAMRTLITAHIEATNSIAKQHQEHERSLEKILRAICINGADERDERLGCLE